MGGGTHRGKAIRENLATARMTAIIGRVTKIAVPAAINIAVTSMSIVVIENALTTGAVIMATTNIKGTDMSIRAIGVHGMSGTGMPEETLRFTSVDIITVTMLI